ncbi:DUF3987 domain-containing protein [Mahella australiensis]|uniref:DUF3987 domain-containing protein n=1 Tax=Mahella australiensis (strain DSM 15567 / CIP 107919 / 50-1 BON) TaxID=697281 RepID=F4A0E7_MAHA5|nr:DUF3987 domain-containing protein [Mahella australiensis]AEE98008.1 hypothetical protein Mahau_2886 [Mahella australiensis 50-1 BON]
MRDKAIDDVFELAAIYDSKKNANHAENIDEIEAVPWPDPMRSSAYHGLAGDVVNALLPYTEADPAALLINFLVGFGNIIGRTAVYDVAGDIHCTNLFALLVGSTSEGRKGSSWAIVKRLLFHIDADWVQYKTPNGLSSGEGLIWAIRDEVSRYDPKQQEEVVIDSGVKDKRLLVVENEFAQALRVMQREGNTLSPILRSAWDGTTLQSLTKNYQAVATNPHVSILGHISPQELRKLLTSTEKFNGFANRYLYICTRRSKLLPDPKPLPESLLIGLASKIKSVIPHESIVMQRDKDGAELWRNIYPMLTAHEDDLVGAIEARAEAQVLRLSMIYALLDGSRMISSKHINAALAIWQYVQASLQFIFGAEADNDPLAGKILAALKRYGELTQTQLYRDIFQCNIAATRITAALQQLSAKGKISCILEKNEGAARSTKKWILNN